MAAVEFKSAHLLGLKIIESPLPVKKIGTTVNPDISEQQHIAGIRIVFGMIGIDGCPVVMDLHIVIGHCNPVFKTGIAIRSDLNGLIAKISELGTERPG